MKSKVLVQIAPDIVMRVDFYKREHNLFEDVWMTDFVTEDEYWKETMFPDAKAFMDLIGDELCPGFLMEMIRDSVDKIKEHETMGSKWLEEIKEYIDNAGL